MEENTPKKRGRKFGSKSYGGRKKTLVARISKEVADRCIQEGMTPLEVMLDNMRYYHQLGQLESAKIANCPFDDSSKEIFKNVKEFRGLAQGCAHDVAPFMHAKLSAIEANVKVANYEAKLAELE